MPEPLSLSKNIGSNTGDNFLRPSNASRPPPPFLRFFLSSRSNRTAPLETLNDPHFCLVVSTFVHRKKIYQQRVTTQEKETTRTTPSPPPAPSRQRTNEEKKRNEESVEEESDKCSVRRPISLLRSWKMRGDISLFPTCLGRVRKTGRSLSVFLSVLLFTVRSTKNDEAAREGGKK